MQTGKIADKLLRFFQETKQFLSKATNRNFLVFMFFLFLSAAFWCVLTLYEEYEVEFSVPVRLQNVPENTVITSNLPSEFHVMLKDKGNELLKYQYTGLPTFDVDFTKYENATGHVVVPTSELMKFIQHKVEPTTQLSIAKAERLEYFYNRNGLKMRFPIQLQSNIQTDRMYMVSSIEMDLDSVTVFSIPEVLDTLRAVYTEPLCLTNLSSTTEKTLRLQPVRGAKIEPSEVKVTITVDQMTEKRVEIPVLGVNFPATKTLRTFPSKVVISFQVGMSQYRDITSDDFVLVLNYEDLLSKTDATVKLSLKSIPNGASNVRIVPETVEFLIEDAINSNN